MPLRPCQMVLIALMAIVLYPKTVVVARPLPDTLWTARWTNIAEQTSREWKECQVQIRAIDGQIADLSAQIAGLDISNGGQAAQVQWMIAWHRLHVEQQRLQNQSAAIQIQSRYRKGLELLKLLYEKVLALDHHFTSLQTQQHIMSLSNPYSFPEFKQAREQIRQKLRKENALDIPPLLDANPYISAAYMLITSIVGLGDSRQREKELSEISCILDFTMQMHSDLSIIQFETQFLNDGNRILREACATLFEEYVKPIGYYASLDLCRKQDDWEKVYAAMERYFDTMETAVITSGETDQKSAWRYQVDLEFSIERLMDFINQYEDFVAQGLRYYQKFEVIINSYSYESMCASQLPQPFAMLKREIAVSIEKFNDSYSMPEIKGSRLKDLMYGIL